MRAKVCLRNIMEHFAVVVVDSIGELIVHLSFQGGIITPEDPYLLGLWMVHQTEDRVAFRLHRHHELYALMLVNRENIVEVFQGFTLGVRCRRDDVVVCVITQRL